MTLEDRDDDNAAPSPAWPDPPAGGRAGSGSGAEPATVMEEVARIVERHGGLHLWPRLEACPACGADDLRPAFAKFGFAHVRCAACGGISLERMPPAAVLDDLYSGRYYSNTRRFFELPRFRKSGALTTLSVEAETLLPEAERLAQGEAGSWLDVGGGFGAFASVLKSRLDGWAVALSEMNGESVRIAMRELGVDVLLPPVRALGAAGRRFDVVSAIAVIEHVPDPAGFVDDLYNVLRPGGRLLIATPHLTELSATAGGASHPAVAPPFHTHLFTKRGLSALLRRHGGFADIEVFDRGAAAFSLIHHADTWQYYDISIPSEDDPVPQTVARRPMPPEVSAMVNALAAADQAMGDHFARSDGRMHLFGTARRAE